ncbi:MAG: acyl carrier protein [Clostridia bacterium]|nr:acyl carrier protein [Clostridia bacterium]
MIFEKIASILSEQLGADKNDITMDTNIAEDLNIDSLDMVDLVMSLEEEYGIEIADDQIEEIVTIGDLVAFIEKNAE